MPLKGEITTDEQKHTNKLDKQMCSCSLLHKLPCTLSSQQRQKKVNKSYLALIFFFMPCDHVSSFLWEDGRELCSLGLRTLHRITAIRCQQPQPPQPGIYSSWRSSWNRFFYTWDPLGWVASCPHWVVRSRWLVTETLVAGGEVWREVHLFPSQRRGV